MYPTKRVAWLTENIGQRGEERFVLHTFDPATKDLNSQKVTTELLDKLTASPDTFLNAEFLGFSHNYIAVRGIEEGNMFYTSYIPGGDDTKLADGTVAYEILGYADTDEEARKLCGWTGGFADTMRMADYLQKTDPSVGREDAIRLAILLERGNACEQKVPTA